MVFGWNCLNCMTGFQERLQLLVMTFSTIASHHLSNFPEVLSCSECSIPIRNQWAAHDDILESCQEHSTLCQSYCGYKNGNLLLLLENVLPKQPSCPAADQLRQLTLGGRLWACVAYYCIQCSICNSLWYIQCVIWCSPQLPAKSLHDWRPTQRLLTAYDLCSTSCCTQLCLPFVGPSLNQQHHVLELPVLLSTGRVFVQMYVSLVE